MSDEAKELMQLAAAKKPIEFADAFNTVMAAKAVAMVDGLRDQVKMDAFKYVLPQASEDPGTDK